MKIALALPLIAVLGACSVADSVQPSDASSSPVFSATQGAKKYDLIGPNAVIFCNSLLPASTSTLWQEGFVRFNFSDGDGTLSAVVSLKGAAPNTSYPVRLIQGNAGDCFVIDGYVETNGQGNGTVHISEPGVSNRAQVIVDTGHLFATPTYRATDIFTW